MRHHPYTLHKINGEQDWRVEITRRLDNWKFEDGSWGRTDFYLHHDIASIGECNYGGVHIDNAFFIRRACSCSTTVPEKVMRFVAVLWYSYDKKIKLGC